MNITRIIQKFIINVRYAFRPKKPVLFFRLICFLFKIQILKKKVLRYVDFAVDYACNMNCEHCFAVSLKKPNAEKLAFADYERIINQSMKLGAVNFSIQGGEPLIYPHLNEFIKICKPGRNIISVTTNALALTKDKISELKKLGVDIFTISLDSGIPEEHDSFRKCKGSFCKTVEAIKEALRQGLHVTIGATVYHQNVKSEGIKKLCELAAQLKCVLCFNLGTPIGNWQSNGDIILTGGDLKYLRELVKSSAYFRTDFEANAGGYGCGAVKEILYLNPYGDVFACPFIHIPLGNAKLQSISEIRKKALENPYYKNYYPKCLCAEDLEFMEKYVSGK
ncbi:MAG TPA: radical SAM protein [bacterium]|nr:radical SAM protein [bacterium]HPN29979.1 radical SAM protein [bacterium]